MSNKYIKKTDSAKEGIIERFKNNRIFKSYLNTIKYANVSKNNWFLMSWVFGKGGCLSPLDTFFNIYIILSIQILIPIYLILQNVHRAVFICPNHSNLHFNKFLTFSLSMLLSMSTYNTFYNMIISTIYYGKFISKKKCIGYFLQAISLIIQLSIMLFVWTLSWITLVNKENEKLNYFYNKTDLNYFDLLVKDQTSYNKVVDILSLTYLTQIDEIFAPNSIQKNFEEFIDNKRKKRIFQLNKHPKTIICIGLFFSIFNFIPIIFSILITYCS